MSTSLSLVPLLEGEVLEPDGTPAGAQFPGLGLSDYETALGESLAQMERSHWRAILILREIRDTGVWKQGRDDDGNGVSNFEDYLSGLRGRVPRMGVRWAQESLRYVDIYHAALGYPLDRLTACSPTSLREATKLVDFDHKAKEVRGFHTPGGKEEVIRLVDDIATPGTRYSDVRKRVQGMLQRPEVSWVIQDEMILAHFDDLVYGVADLCRTNHLPHEVLADLRRRLNITQ